jgi:hypothetical protein
MAIDILLPRHQRSLEMLLLLPSSTMLLQQQHRTLVTMNRHPPPPLALLRPAIRLTTAHRACQPMSSPARPRHSISFRCLYVSWRCAAGLDRSAVEFTACARGAWQLNRLAAAQQVLSFPPTYLIHTLFIHHTENLKESR